MGSEMCIRDREQTNNNNNKKPLTNKPKCHTKTYCAERSIDLQVNVVCLVQTSNNNNSMHNHEYHSSSQNFICMDFMFCSITGNNEIHIVDPNGIKGSKQRYLLGHNAACKFSGWSPLSSNKTTLKQQLNG